MKSIIRMLFAVLPALMFSECDEIEALLTFSVNDQTAISIDSSVPVSLPLEIPTPPVTSNARQQYENNNTRAELVKDVRLESLKLTITDPPDKTFNFLKDIRIYISASGQSEILLASLDVIPQSTGIIDLDPTSQKLDPYLKEASYDLRTEITTDETLTERVDVQVDLRFRVTADTF